MHGAVPAGGSEGGAAPRHEPYLTSRYSYKLGSNLVGMLIALGTQAIVPRALGPARYGNFSFLTAFFSQVVDFFDSGTSVGFYSKLSQRRRDPGLVRFYWGFALAVSALLVMAAGMVFVVRLGRWVWPGQETRFIWMAVLWGLLNWYVQIENKMLDAYGLTVDSEILRMLQKAVGFGLVLVMFATHQFSLFDFFLYQYAVLLFLWFGWRRVLARHGFALRPAERLARDAVRGYARELYDYSAPLVWYALVVMVGGALDRWILQRFGGSVEQGFYGLAFQIGTLCFLFTSAMTPLFMREIAAAFGASDYARMRMLFRRTIPMLYAVGAYFAMFVLVQAHKVVLIFGGSRYERASLTIAIMAVYPVHRTYGQLSGSVLLATGQTRLQRNIGIIATLAGLPLTLVTLAPPSMGGLGLGAEGLALKMVVMQLAIVNVVLWFNSRQLGLSFWWYVWHQFYCVAALGSVAWACVTVTDSVITSTVPAFLASGVFYTAACTALLMLVPAVFGMDRQGVAQLLRRMRGALAWGAAKAGERWRAG
jgi:O-antigen/teichoic acid export membrane protein